MKNSPEKKIRCYCDKDEKQVVALWHSCKLIRSWNDPRLDIERKKGIQASLFLVAELDGRIIGSIMGGYEGHRGVINYLAVDPEYRRQGLATELVSIVEKRLKGLGCPKINLLVRTDNSEVEKCYTQLHFRKQEDVLVFGKRLISDEKED